MTLAQWLGTHPLLARRIAALDPSLSPETQSYGEGTLRALAIILVGGIYAGARGVFPQLGSLLAFGRNQRPLLESPA